MPFSGKKLMAMRLAWGLSPRELAKATAIPPQRILHYERGVFTPGANVLERLALALRMDMEEFFTPPKRRRNDNAKKT